MKSFLYQILRIYNDINAVQKGRVGGRVWNKMIGRFLSRLFRR